MSGTSPERTRPGEDPPEAGVDVFGSDEQADHPVDLPVWTDLARACLLTEGVTGAAEMALLFVDAGTMRDLNERFMGRAEPTDVLAFPIDEAGTGERWPDAASTGPGRDRASSDDVPVLLGDVVVCPAVAHRQAREHDRSPADEVALLVVHGVLHVLGHDHAEPDEARHMREREQDLLRRHHLQGR